MKLLLEDYEYKKAQLDSVMEEIESMCKKIPESGQMLAIKGIGIITVAGFLAEVVNDIRQRKKNNCEIQENVHRKVLKGTERNTKT